MNHFSETTIGPLTRAPVPYKILLVLVYAIMFVYVSIQMIITLRGKNKKRSFNFGFLLICLLWVGVRLIYFVHFLISDPNPSSWWDLANTAAVDIQFAACTFLMLFYTRIMMRMRWQACRKKLSMAVFIINAIFDSFSLAVFVLQQLYVTVFPNPPSPSPSHNVHLFNTNFDDEKLTPSPHSFYDNVPAPAPNDNRFSDALENVYVEAFWTCLCYNHHFNYNLNANRNNETLHTSQFDIAIVLFFKVCLLLWIHLFYSLCVHVSIFSSKYSLRLSESTLYNES